MKQSNIQISVIMTTYNHEKYIYESIASILNQTFRDFELIIIDDGSRDRTAEIIKTFDDPRIQYTYQENQGVSTAINNGLMLASGEYIALMSGDDVCYLQRLETQYNYLSSTSEKIILFSWVDFINENSEIFSGSPHIQENLFNRENQSSEKILREFFEKGNYINGPSGFFKREALINSKLFHTTSIQVQDFYKWIELLGKGYDIYILSEKLLKYRVNGQTLSQSKNSRTRAIFEYEILLKYFFDDIPMDLFRKAFGELIKNSDFNSDVEYELEKAFLYLRYDSSLLRKIGTEKLFDLLKDPDILAISKLKYNFDLPILYKAMSSILDSNDEALNSRKTQASLLRECQEFLFNSNHYFNKVAEATEYGKHIQRWISYAHQSIFIDTEDRACQSIVAKLAKNTNFICAYFNEENLRDIYIKRAEIIRLYLQNNRIEVDYQFDKRPANRKKIRLGILASHFTPSAETFAALPAYEYLSRDFEVVLYSLQQTNHPLEQYCRSSANFFVTLPDGLAEQVSAIRGDDLDILFFATNVTAVTNQMCLLASHRLARIQITSGGSVVTTGMKHMDYFISGTFTDPSPVAQEQYREELIQFPGAAHCFSYGDFEERSSITIDRQDLGIADDAVVFTSGANFYKIIPELIHTWAKIIAAVPNSTIVLFPFGPNWSSSYPKQTFEQHLHKIFAEYGVSADRVIALDPQPVPNREDLKEYYKLADVYLDSYPFAGTTSLIEPLQVNLPVIARQGNSFRSSMGAAMIRSLEITDLVADSEESYIQLAVALGNNPELRQQKSAEVKAKMADNPSFLDSKGYGAKIGELFKELVDRYSRDALSDNLRLKDVNLMVFPDWSQSEESVGLELQQVIQTLATQPDAQKTTLLIDTTNIAIEDAEMFLSSVAMNLMMEEDLDIMEELEISLIEDLNNIQWDNLLPRISARIVLECDNQEVVGKLPQEKLLQRQLNSFVLS